MQMSVIGCGYLGAVHAACMAWLGHDVVGVDVDEDKVAALNAGHPPFHEPGLEEVLMPALESGRLRFSTDLAVASGARVHFVCVGTPQRADGRAADVGQVDQAVRALLEHLRVGDVVVGKSTVPVGTADRLSAMIIERAPGALLGWNPEFLREGYAVADTLRPDRLVLGLPDQGAAAVSAVFEEVYEDALSAGTPVVVSDFATAELVKVAANSFLATKISFINAMAEVCEATGADVTRLAEALGHDARIGRRFLNAGVGFGGGCLPKDLRAFAARAEELGVVSVPALLGEVEEINSARRSRVVDLVREAVGGDVTGRRVAVLGAAFKPNSDDVRDSPALAVARTLQDLGARVRVTDPYAVANARRADPELDLVQTVSEAVCAADVVVLLTEWEEYGSLDPEVLRGLVAGRVIIDGRNVLDPDRWQAAGWEYRALGRRPSRPVGSEQRPARELSRWVPQESVAG
ncbi:MAG: UDP-glucose dehydrogenase family protein [Propionibacteriaceae bacterium]